jgi:hypothetical protein
MWMDKYTHDKQIGWTEHRILFDVLPVASPSVSTAYCADQITYLRYIQLWSARSGQRLVQVGTARQRYTCSKNIYFVGNRNTLSIVMGFLLLILYCVFY